MGSDTTTGSATAGANETVLVTEASASVTAGAGSKPAGTEFDIRVTLNTTAVDQ